MGDPGTVRSDGRRDNFRDFSNLADGHHAHATIEPFISIYTGGVFEAAHLERLMNTAGFELHRANVFGFSHDGPGNDLSFS